MSFIDKWVLSLLPAVLLVLLSNLKGSTKSSYRSVCVAIVKAARQIELAYAGDSKFQKEVNG